MTDQVEAAALGDRLGAIRKLLDLLKRIDPQQLNAFVAKLLEFAALVAPWFGLSVRVAADTLSLDEEELIRREFEPIAQAASEGSPQAQAINIGAIIALIKMILEILAAFKKPTA